MSHCPGLRLEDFVSDLFGVIDANGEYATAIRRFYKGELIFDKEQFQGLVSFYEPFRQIVEEYLLRYDEEENGSWRDFRNYVVYPSIPDATHDQADLYVIGLRDSVEKTAGLTS